MRFAAISQLASLELWNHSRWKVLSHLTVLTFYIQVSPILMFNLNKPFKAATGSCQEQKMILDQYLV